MISDRSIIWKRGEELASEHLRNLGHQIVARNWRSSHLELDIVSLEGGILHIVEVKSREVPSSSAPEEAVGPVKQKKLVAAAKAFLNSRDRKPLPEDLEIWFDVITVLIDGPEYEIEYYPQAFIPIYA